MKCTLFFRLWKFFLPSWGPKCFYFTVVNVRLNSLVVSPSSHVFQVDTQYLSSHLWVWEGGGDSLLLLFLKQGMSAWIHLCLFFSTCVPGGHTMFFLSLVDVMRGWGESSVLLLLLSLSLWQPLLWVSESHQFQWVFFLLLLYVICTHSNFPCLFTSLLGAWVCRGSEDSFSKWIFGSKLLLCLGTMS